MALEKVPLRWECLEPTSMSQESMWEPIFSSDTWRSRFGVIQCSVLRVSSWSRLHILASVYYLFAATSTTSIVSFFNFGPGTWEIISSDSLFSSAAGEVSLWSFNRRPWVESCYFSVGKFVDSPSQPMDVSYRDIRQIYAVRTSVVLPVLPSDVPRGSVPGWSHVVSIVDSMISRQVVMPSAL